MPGKKHMNQDRPANGQDTLQTMQDKSGIYQDRTDGKLPQGRVAQHYQAMDAKMEQTKEGDKPKNTSGIFGGDTIFGDENKDGNVVTRAFDAITPNPTGDKATKSQLTNPYNEKSSLDSGIRKVLNKIFY